LRQSFPSIFHQKPVVPNPVGQASARRLQKGELDWEAYQKLVPGWEAELRELEELPASEVRENEARIAILRGYLGRDIDPIRPWYPEPNRFGERRGKVVAPARTKDRIAAWYEQGLPDQSTA
jgi:hypothetical protein